IDYTIAEAKVEGYTSQITGSMEEGFVITNVKENIIVNKSDSFNNITGEINIDKKDSFDSIKTDDESYLTISTFLFMTSLLGIIILGAYEIYLKKVNK
ncbi:Cna B-type domain-containing protein, partial [Clostridium sp. AUH-JLR23]|uniref:Cna B-type domain-containing protein n=1 Tax=Clostridium sp. AUH-JLR23 TaxID=1505062 RepID=UPI00356168A8